MLNRNVDYYLKKITSAHHDKPKYIEWLNVLLECVIDFRNLMASIPRAFSVNNAVGVQLDVVGLIVGVSRTSAHMAEEGGDGLSDEDYRRLIKAAILKNGWNGQAESLQALWQTIYPEIQLSYLDNLDMTVTIHCRGDISPVMQEMIQTGFILPVPMGVYATYSVQVIEPPERVIYTATGIVPQGAVEAREQGV